MFTRRHVEQKQYMLHVTLTHPEYSHISPAAASIYEETPIWIVLSKPNDASNAEKDAPGATEPASNIDRSAFSKLPMTGEAIPVSEDAVIAEIVKGGPTRKVRPLAVGPRYGGT